MINRNLLFQYLKLSPIILLIVAGFVYFMSRTVSNYLTLIAFLFCITYSILHFHKIPKYLKIGFLITTLYLGAVSINTYSIEAAISDGLRYLLPFVALGYGLAFNNSFMFLVKSLLVILLINNIYQCITYIIYALDTNLYYDLGNSTNTVKGLLRAGGITHSFDFFGFSNLMGFYLCFQFYNKKFAYVFVIFLFLSLSFKYIFLCFALLLWLKKFKEVLFIILIGLVVVALNRDLSTNIKYGMVEKYDRFLVEYNSPRPESYRVLKQHLYSNSVFSAEGVGVFGGPASTLYNSRYYDKVNFDWHGREFATTDTYYPHLFIELGLVQGLIYLGIVFSVFIIEYRYLKKIAFIIVLFSVSSILNFSLNNFLFLIISFVLILPLLHFQKTTNKAILS